MENEPREDDVVISGIGCRFPESSNIEELAELLYAGEDLITVDNRKWKPGYFDDCPDYSGKLKNMNRFDSTFFGINRMLTRSLDPITRFLLEATCEAVIDSGNNPADLKGTNASVFFGSCIAEADIELIFDFKGGYGIMGRNRSMNANRISYWLDVKGKSVAYDANWCCGVEGIQLAAEAIRSGETEMAVVATGNMLLHPEVSLQYRHAGVLSSDGKCKSFDADANGYTRSDAICVFILQRASMAKRIYATIVNSFTLCYGDRTDCFSAPSKRLWLDMLSESYQQSGINPDDVCYIEANGDGIKEHDEAELNALDEFFCKNREQPLLIGSVKSNLGHTEASSVMSSLAKIIIAFQNDKIPGNLHYNKPNPNINGLLHNRLQVVSENMPTPEGLYAINSCSVSGMYGHLVIRPNLKRKPRETPSVELPKLLLVSSRTQDNMDPLLSKLEDMPFDSEYIRLLQDVYTRKISKYLGRGYTILPQLDGVKMKEHQIHTEEQRPIWFIYSGMGSQWNGMATWLMHIPIFRKAIEKCHNVLLAYGVNLIDIITTDDKTIFDNILHSFVGIAAIQVGLTDILEALEIKPSGIIGHSVGELGCAYADGCFTAEEMVLAAYCRGRASIETELIRGKMAAIGKGYQEMKSKLPEGIEVACHNGPDSCTLSGPADVIESFVKELQSQGVFARSVNVSNIAYHSQYIRPAAPKLLEYLKQVLPEPKLRSKKWISTSVPFEKWGTQEAKFCSPEYHTNNLLGSVLFEEGSKFIPKNAIAIEIAPHGLLQAILKRSLSPECINIPLTNRNAKNGLYFILQSIGKMYLSGLEPQVSNLYEEISYPVSRGTPSLHQLISWEHDDEWNIGLKKLRDVDKTNKFITITLNPDLEAYSFDNKHIYPFSYYLVRTWELLANIREEEMHQFPVIFEDLRFLKIVDIPPTESVEIHIMIQKGSGRFEITHDEILVMSGRIIPTKIDIKKEYIEETDKLDQMDQEDIYTEFEHRAIVLKDGFRNLISVTSGSVDWKCQIIWKNDIGKFLDGILQLVMLHNGDRSVPVQIVKMSIDNVIMEFKENTVLNATYNTKESIVRCGPIEISGIRMQEIELESKYLQFASFQFLPYSCVHQKDSKDFLNSCIDTAVRNSIHIKKSKRFSILQVTGGNDYNEVSTYIQDYIIGHFKMQVDKLLCNKDNDFLNVRADLVVAGAEQLRRSEIVADTNRFVLILGPINDNNNDVDGDNSNLIPIARFRNENEELRLLRKTVYNITDHLNVFEISGEESDWHATVAELKKGVKNNTCMTYIVCRNEPLESVHILPAKLQKDFPYPHRLYVLLDDSCPKFDVNDNFYANEIKKDLLVNVYYNGEWGFINSKDVSQESLENLSLEIPKAESELQVSFMCLDLRKSGTIGKRNQLEYSGIVKETYRSVMGVTAPALNLKTISCDPNLTWDVPNNWTLEDAVTVPLAYCISYYCLVLIKKIKPTENIFIHDGCCVNGQALIAVASSYGATIYTVVFNEDQKRILLMKYPKLKEENIFVDDGKNFDVSLLFATNGVGSDCVVNCTGEEEIMQTVFHCTAKNGRFFTLSNTDFVKNKQLTGTCLFIENCVFYGVAGDDIINSTIEWKKQLFNLISEGISEGIVQPFERKIFDSHNLKDASLFAESCREHTKVVLRINPSDTHFSHNKPTHVSNGRLKGLNIDASGSYIILGDDSNYWLDAAQWLCYRNAKSIVISHTMSSISSSIERRIKLLSKKGTKFILFGFEVTDFRKLVSAANSLGPLAAVFIIKLEKNAKENSITVKQVDQYYRRKHDNLICIVNEAGIEAKICGFRHKVGLPGLAVIWKIGKSDTLRHLFSTLDRLTYSSPVLTVMSDVSLNRKHQENAERLIDQLLPKDISDMASLAASLSEKPRLIEMNSLCCSAAEVKEVSPLIFMPGLHNNPITSLKPLAEKLLYPVFCVQYSTNMRDIKEVAKALIPILKEKIKGKIFNLVGVLWSGCLALELAFQLEALGDWVSVTIIDGPPEALKEALLNMENDKDAFETTLLLKMFKISSNKIISEMLEQKSWSNRLSIAIEEVINRTDRSRSELRTGATFIYHNILALIDYEQNPNHISGPTCVVHPGNVQDALRLQKTCEIFDHRTAPLNVHELEKCSELRKVLHESALCELMHQDSLKDIYNNGLENLITKNKFLMRDLAFCEDKRTLLFKQERSTVIEIPL